MSAEKCSGCGAPRGASSLVCEFCGALFKPPSGVEEELAVLRDQGTAAQRIGTEKGATAALLPHLAAQSRGERLAGFWSNAYMPTSVSAIKAAIEQCATVAPKVKGGFDGDPNFVLLQAISARVEGLALSLDARAEATEEDRRFSRSVAERLFSRVSEYEGQHSKSTRLIYTAAAAVFVIAYASLIVCNKTKPRADVCREYISSYKSVLDAELGTRGMAACLEECSAGQAWACTLVEEAKRK